MVSSPQCGFFDHTPVWCAGTVDERPIYAEFEAAARTARKRMSRQRRQAEHRADGQVLAEQHAGTVLPQPSAPVQGADRPVQTVSAGSGASQKSRLTLILFQSVEKWFDPESTPVVLGR